MNQITCHPSAATPKNTDNRAPLEIAVARLESSVSILGDDLAELNSRLENILAQAPATPSAHPSTVAPGSSAVVNKVTQITERVELMIRRLATIRTDLEL